VAGRSARFPAFEVSKHVHSISDAFTALRHTWPLREPQRRAGHKDGTTKDGTTDTVKSAAGAPTETTLVERLYPVGDLVVPVVETAKVDVRNFVRLSERDKVANSNATDIQPLATMEKRLKPSVPVKTSEDELIAMLTTCVDPTSWAGKGGKATIAYHSGCMTLAVHAFPATRLELPRVLSELRGASRRRKYLSKCA